MNSESYCKNGDPHFWVIDLPAGPKSFGKCKRCKQTKEFDNSIKDLSWGDDPVGHPSGWARGGSCLPSPLKHIVRYPTL